jgi:hypothetical protein
MCRKQRCCFAGTYTTQEGFFLSEACLDRSEKYDDPIPTVDI